MPPSTEIRSMDARIACRHCRWSGEVNQLVYDPKSLNGDEDGPRAYNCPTPECKKTLAVQGWLGFDAILENALLFS